MCSSQNRTDSLHIQERDLAILRGLFESRVMTTAHISVLYFDGLAEAAKKRLQSLKSARLIAERPRRLFEPAILYLTRAGLDVLNERGILTDYPAFSIPALEKRARVSDATIRHELEVMDVKASFSSAVRKTEGYSIAEFTTWPLLNEFEIAVGVAGAEATVKPDGFIRIGENGRDGNMAVHSFFLEIDRSTEAQSMLVSRAHCYLDYYKSGGFAARNGGKRTEYRGYPFRVLFVFQTDERRNNTAERLLQNSPPILSHVWLTTIREMASDPLGAIWIRPIDYRDAVKGVLFDAANRRQSRGYQRNIARERHIESLVTKSRLLVRQ